MARSIKKVKKPKTAKFYIIVSCAAVVAVIGAIVGALLGYSLSNSKKLTRRFTEYTEYKINYNELEKKLEDKDNQYQELFVFTYDSSYMFDKPKKVKEYEDEYQTYLKYQELTQEIANFKALVDKANEVERKNELKTGFFVIDASLQTNTAMIGNESYDSISSPGLFTFYVGKVNSDTTTNKLTYIKSNTKFEPVAENSPVEGYKTETYTGMSGGSTAADMINSLKTAEQYLIYYYGVSLD
ncbi:MAG: hypothetical protein K6G28_01430 [Acholeplasmatales bacterium]|nr:hypothetical protein [Acholeplasmatales bacterium]